MWVNGRARAGDGATSAPAKSQQSCFALRQVIRFAAVALAAATLGACAQSPLVTRQYAAVAPVQEAAPEPERAAPVVRRAAVATKKRTALATAKPEASKPAASTRDAAQGLASYYRFHGRRTASGEKFDETELTAAHRTLPFGTRLRVTNVATGTVGDGPGQRSRPVHSRPRGRRFAFRRRGARDDPTGRRQGQARRGAVAGWRSVPASIAGIARRPILRPQQLSPQASHRLLPALERSEDRRVDRDRLGRRFRIDHHDVRGIADSSRRNRRDSSAAPTAR